MVLKYSDPPYRRGCPCSLVIDGDNESPTKESGLEIRDRTTFDFRSVYGHSHVSTVGGDHPSSLNQIHTTHLLTDSLTYLSTYLPLYIVSPTLTSETPT